MYSDSLRIKRHTADRKVHIFGFGKSGIDLRVGSALHFAFHDRTRTLRSYIISRLRF